MLVRVLVIFWLGYALAVVGGHIWVLYNASLSPSGVVVETPYGEGPIEVVFAIFAFIAILGAMALIIKGARW
jgi:hypothetical protein